jgi:hypothetical protein
VTQKLTLRETLSSVHSLKNTTLKSFSTIIFCLPLIKNTYLFLPTIPAPLDTNQNMCYCTHTKMPHFLLSPQWLE